jgi:hypothetical protein
VDFEVVGDDGDQVRGGIDEMERELSIVSAVSDVLTFLFAKPTALRLW